jgi:hypothetical protein
MNYLPITLYAPSNDKLRHRYAPPTRSNISEVCMARKYDEDKNDDVVEKLTRSLEQREKESLDIPKMISQALLVCW